MQEGMEGTVYKATGTLYSYIIACCILNSHQGNESTTYYNVHVYSIMSSLQDYVTPVKLIAVIIIIALQYNCELLYYGFKS